MNIPKSINSFQVEIPMKTKLRLRVVEDRPYWLDKNPNFSRLQMAVNRGAVVYGKDHVKILKKIKGESHE